MYLISCQILKEIGYSSTNPTREDDLRLMKCLLSKLRNAEKFPEYANRSELYSACATMWAIWSLDLEHADDPGTLLSIYNLGCARGALEGVDLESMPSKLYEDHFHSVKSKSAVEKRWKATNDAILKALAEADKRWKSGEEALHHEMAQHLSNKYNVSYNTLKKRLKPIARIHNRLFGVKGVRKNIN